MFRRLFVILTLVSLVFPAAARAQDDLIDTPGTYVVLMDADTGEVLYNKNGDVRMAPASMSKLMTIAVLFDAIDSGVYSLNDTFHVSRKAWQKGGSKMWVMVDTDIRIEDLIQGIIVQSGNDACIVVAEGIAGSEDAFAERMTEFGQRIGLQNSTFRNSTGWPDPNHMMTAHDLALLARYLIKQHPDLYHYFAEQEFSWSDITQPNRNPLLFLNLGADGLKTGHTEESGYGLVGSSVRDGQRMIMVVNGLNSERERASEGRRLLEVAHREFKHLDLFAAGEEVSQATVWNGQAKRVPLVVNDDVKAVLHRRVRDDLKVTVNYSGPLPAPIVAGTQVATLTVEAPGMTTKEVPLYAGADVDKVGFFGRLGSAIGVMLYGPPN
ncbi:MAG: D-alanyl-D-alanine carboxypeptidase [Alphaproteobacteria bacterium]|nr:MAG: D-alanyl-D-alanine carboxypeptidase [Alphaproteobacteria bacterium]